MTRRHLFVGVAVVLVVTGLAAGTEVAQSIAAGALLHPSRKAVVEDPPSGCEATSFAGARVILSGWRCSPGGIPRATVVLLHGVADNRAGWRSAIEHFAARGFEVVAYDSRAHGGSTGDACTYGFFEKRDLHRVLDQLKATRVVLVGTSLGAAIALQEAAGDPRISAVVAAETFSDLRTVAAERVPYLPQGIVDRAFDTAERRASFVADAVSPLRAAKDITAPVLLIHGADDVETNADHSRRVYAALRGQRRLILVPGVGHNHSLNSAWVWSEIDRWIERSLGDQPGFDIETGAQSGRRPNPV